MFLTNNNTDNLHEFFFAKTFSKLSLDVCSSCIVPFSVFILSCIHISVYLVLTLPTIRKFNLEIFQIFGYDFYGSLLAPPPHFSTKLKRSFRKHSSYFLMVIFILQIFLVFCSWYTFRIVMDSERFAFYGSVFLIHLSPSYVC